MRALVVLGLLAFVGPAGADDFLQAGGDGAHSGVMDDDDLPAHLNIGFQVDKPGDHNGADIPAPLVFADHALVLDATSGPLAAAGVEPTSVMLAVHRIDFATGTIDEWISIAGERQYPIRWASDGEGLFVHAGGDLLSYGLEDGALRGEKRLVGATDAGWDTGMACGRLTVADGLVMIACGAVESPLVDPVANPFVEVRSSADLSLVSCGVPVVYAPGVHAPLSCPSPGTDVAVGQASYLAGSLYVPTTTAKNIHRVLRMDVATGSVDAVFETVQPGSTHVTQDAINEAVRVAYGAHRFATKQVLATPEVVAFPVGGWVYLLDPADLSEIDRRQLPEALGRSYTVETVTGNSQRIVVGNNAGFLALEPLTGRELFRIAVGAGDTGQFADRALHTPQFVFLLHENGRLVKYDWEGKQIDQAKIGTWEHWETMAAAHGRLVHVRADPLVEGAGPGVITVFGDVPAGIGLRASISGAAPPVGSPVAIDVSGTRPGVAASDLEYTVLWGDGSSDYGPGPIFQHEYGRAGDVTVKLTASNSAGQTAIHTFHLDVGASRPTWLETRFNAENQETTFFILGLIITALAAAFAAARLGRKRSRLRRELAAVDAAARTHAGNPLALHRAMAERREHAKTLLVAKRLDEGQYSVLKGHIDSVAAGSRLESIEQDFPFLPVSLAGTLQRMLDDGRLTKWERRSFLDALAADDVLTSGQKAKVRGRIEAWFREDS